MPRVDAMSAHAALGVPRVPVHAPVHAETLTRAISVTPRRPSARGTGQAHSPDMPRNVWRVQNPQGLWFCIRAPDPPDLNLLYTRSAHRSAFSGLPAVPRSVVAQLGEIIDLIRVPCRTSAAYCPARSRTGAWRRRCAACAAHQPGRRGSRAAPGHAARRRTGPHPAASRPRRGGAAGRPVRRTSERTGSATSEPGRVRPGSIGGSPRQRRCEHCRCFPFTPVSHRFATAPLRVIENRFPCPSPRLPARPPQHQNCETPDIQLPVPFEEEP